MKRILLCSLLAAGLVCLIWNCSEKEKSTTEAKEVSATCEPFCEKFLLCDQAAFSVEFPSNEDCLSECGQGSDPLIECEAGCDQEMECPVWLDCKAQCDEVFGDDDSTADDDDDDTGDAQACYESYQGALEICALLSEESKARLLCEINAFDSLLQCLKQAGLDEGFECGSDCDDKASECAEGCDAGNAPCVAGCRQQWEDCVAACGQVF